MNFTGEKNSKQLSKFNPSYHIKILMNYFQVIGILAYFDIKWPSYLSGFFNIAAIFGNYSTGTLAVECISREFGISLKLIYLNLYLLLLLPLIVFLLILGILMINRIFKAQHLYDKFFLSILIICALIQSSITQSLFDNINYIKVDSDVFLIKQIGVRFYSEEHQQWVK